MSDSLSLVELEVQLKLKKKNYKCYERFILLITKRKLLNI